MQIVADQLLRDWVVPISDKALDLFFGANFDKVWTEYDSQDTNQITLRDSPTFLRDLFTRQVPGYEINVGKNPYEIEGAEEDKPLEDGKPQ